MKAPTWISILFILLLAVVSTAGALAADGSGSPPSQAVVDANTVSLADAGPLAQIFTGGVALLLILMALAPVVFGREPGAGIHIQ